MAGAWPDEVRRKLEAQGLDPTTAARVAEEAARWAPAAVGDPRKLRAAALLHLLLGLLVVASAIGSAILNHLLRARALVYAGSGAAAAWGALLCWRGLTQWCLSRRGHRTLPFRGER
jgi:hypothetical protein